MPGATARYIATIVLAVSLFGNASAEALDLQVVRVPAAKRALLPARRLVISQVTRWDTLRLAARVAADDGQTDLEREASVFAGGKRSLDGLIVRGFGGPPFPWITHEMICPRSTSCGRGHFGARYAAHRGIGWTGGGGPAWPFFERAGILLEASVSMTLVGFFAQRDRLARPLTAGGLFGLGLSVDKAEGPSLSATASVLVFPVEAGAPESHVFLGAALEWR